jgi:hypothetical protein
MASNPASHSQTSLRATVFFFPFFFLSVNQLDREAVRAKSIDSELYQRKTKLLPKYQSMVKSLQSHFASLNEF